LKVEVLIDNRAVNDPNNLKELGIELNFDKDNPTSQVSLNDWELGVGDSSKPDGSIFANRHLTNGLSGGVGALEGLPFVINLDLNGQVVNAFKGYLDLSEATFECDLVSATAIEQGGVDWFNNRVDSFSFEYLYDTGVITTNDFVAVPYVINSIPKYGEAALMTIAVFSTIQTIKAEVQTLTEMSIETSNPVSAISGILKISLRVLYIAALLITVVKLILDVIRLLIQPVKYHKGMYANKMLEKGANYLGLKFQSSIFENSPFNKMFILSNQFEMPDDKKGLLGFFEPKQTQLGYLGGTYGDFMRSMKKMFNAKVIVQDGVVRFERRDFNLSSPIYQIPPIERNGFRVNGSEFIGNYYINFDVDYNDKNTIQQYSGTAFGCTTTYKTATNKDMVLLRGGEQVSIPFALAKIKTELTPVEEIVRAFAVVFDPVIGVLVKIVNEVIRAVNAIIKAIKNLIDAINWLPGIEIDFDPKPIKPISYTPLKELIENRIGMLMLENDFINTPKVFLLNQASKPRYNKPSSNNKSLINAEYLYDNYHFINSFDPAVYSKTNQYKLYSIQNLPFTCSDFLKVRKNNRIFDGEKQGQIDSLKWNIDKQTADIEFRVNEIWTRNLKTVKKLSSKTPSNPLI
jgi:hypothetical protein